MKKTYTVPMIAVEHYELTQAIAACAVKIGATNSQCVIKDDDPDGYMKSLAGAGWFKSCTEEYLIDGEYEDGICYHTSANAAFAS